MSFYLPRGPSSQCAVGRECSQAFLFLFSYYNGYPKIGLSSCSEKSRALGCLYTFSFDNRLI